MGIIYFFCFLSSNIAQEAPLKFEQIAKDEGYLQSSVLSIVQDEDGFLWFSSYGGLYRYDGITFKSYYADLYDSTSIPDNTIEELYVDREGILWLGTNNGLAKYNKAKDNFFVYQNNPNDSTSLGFNQIRALLEDKAGNFWIGTYGGGLNLFDRKTNTFKRFSYNSDIKNSISHNFISELFEDSDGEIWIATDGGLNNIDPVSYKFTCFKYEINNPNSISSNSVISITEDDNGFLWVGTWGGGLNRFNKKTGIFKHYKYDENKDNSLSDNIVKKMLFDSRGFLWIGTYGNGLDRFDFETESFIHHRASYSNEHSISNNTITSLYEDNSGNLWIGTQYSGINMIDFYKNQFQHFTVNSDDENSLSHKHVTAICEDSLDNIWIATFGGGVNKIKKKTSKYTHFNKNNEKKRKLKSNLVRTIYTSSDNTVWLAGIYGLESIDPKTDVVTSYESGIDKFTSVKDIFHITEDSNGNLWFSTWNKGIDKYNPKTNKYTNYAHDPNNDSSLNSNKIMSVYEDKVGDIWVATISDGLNKLIENNAGFKKYIHDKNDTTTISSDKIHCFAEDNNGNLWIGADNALNLYHREKDEFEKIDLGAFWNNAIFTILTNGNDLWMSTGNGIIKYNTRTKSVTGFTRLSGLQSNEFFIRSGFKSKEGRLFFGGINGCSAFYPNEIIKNPKVPQIFITNLYINSENILIDTKYEENVILDSSIAYTKEIVLNHNQNYLSIEFAALNYNSPCRNQYKYFLEGYDEEWTNLEKVRPAYYTNILPGEYTFMVTASNNDGLWNKKPTQLKIIILPPFWQATWFKLLFTLAIIGLMSLLYKYRVSTIKKHNIKLKAEVEKQTRKLKKSNVILENEIQIRIVAEEEIKRNLNELEKSKKAIAHHANELNDLNIKLSESEKVLKELNASKDKFFSIIAHDLRNPFTTLLGYTKLLQEDYDDFDKNEIKESLISIHRMANVVYTLLDNLLKWSSIQTGRMVYMPEAFSINKVVTQILLLNNDTAAKKDIKLIQKIDAEINIYADKLMIETVLRNLISNAIKFTNNKGTVIVQAIEKENYTVLEVKDSGVGISKEDIGKLFKIDVHHSTGGTNNEKGSGLGLILCKELIEKNNGEIRVESELGKGSSFVIKLPLANKRVIQVPA